MSKKNVLVVCAMARDKYELGNQRINDEYNIYFHEFDKSLLTSIFSQGVEVSHDFKHESVIQDLADACEALAIDGVIGSQDYPGSIFTAIVAHKIGLIAPAPEPVLLCHHKYYSRLAQKKYVSPATPRFCLLHPDNISPLLFDLSFPVFVKPVKSSFSLFANCVDTFANLTDVTKKSALSKSFIQQFDWFLRNYFPCDTKTDCLLVEECLKGVQCTVEGYVSENGIHFFGVTDSIMVPGTISFEQFEYPSSLPDEVQNRIYDISRKFISNIGFDNGFFNIEFMYNPETDGLFIIEVNPRMASQFADLYEKVDGINSYDVLLALATGKKFKFTQSQGKYSIAASFVLRQFEDATVVQTPSQDDIESFYKQFPDARLYIFVAKGMRLSDVEQDGKSYRYALVHLGARDKQELFEKYERAKTLLPFKFI